MSRSQPAVCLDPHKLEKRTQAIGRELFAQARRGHAHLSVLNRWTAQVLSWCLSDPGVKSSLLRFIDVLPALQNPRDIARHALDYFPSTDLRLPPALRLGTQLARPGLMTQRALAAAVRQMTEQVARQFIAQAAPQSAGRLVKAMAARGATVSLDVLGEQVLSEPEADAYASSCAGLIQQCAPEVNLSVKPSALTPRFDPISPADSVERAERRLLPLLKRACACRGLVNLDMEQYALRDLTIQLAQRVLLHADHGEHAHLGIVVQAYLKDSAEILEALLEWLKRHERTLTIRLVKGAYWDAEMAQADQNHWSSPVYERKAETDASFERLTQRLLSEHPLVTTAIASHNIRSIAHAMAVAESLDLPKDQLEFQLLYGMGDALHAAIAARGWPVRIYTPIGELIPGMAYLVRRILENTANESFLRQDFMEEGRAEELLKAPAAVPVVEAAPQEETAPYAEPMADFSRSAAQQRMQQALAEVARLKAAQRPLWIGSRQLLTASALVARNPAHPNQALGSVSQADASHVEDAVAAASAAQPRWARIPAAERAALLRQAAGLVRKQRMELAALCVLEVGKTWREADVEIVETIEYLEYYSRSMEQLAQGRAVDRVAGERNVYRYIPRGVAVVIAPWNFPAAIFTGMAAAALVTGNTVILKPAEQSCLIAAALVELLRKAGIPPEAISFLPGPGEVVGAALVAHPGIHTVLFTGSKAVGLSIVEACGKVAPGQRHVKHVITEMGGKNAIIVDADADLDAAVSGILRSAFSYAGQKCSAASRLIIHEAVYERLLARLTAAADRLVVGDPADSATDIGPLIGPSAQQRLEQAREYARSKAKIIYEYPQSRLPAEGHYFGPTLVGDVDGRDRLATEELFGPLLCLFRAKNLDEAIALANDTDYALTGGIYSRSPSHISRVMQDFDVGNLYINRPITGAMVGRQPFGGHRLSGLGTKAGGPDYLLQLVLPKTISVNTTRHGMPLEE